MIKKLSMMMATLGVLAFLTAPPSGAQQQAPPAAVPGQPAARQAAKLYNPQTVEILAGKVVAVNHVAPKKAGRPERVTMVLQTDKGAVKVHLGPADYIDPQMQLAVGDQVEVKGVRAARPRVTMFIAGEVKKGDQVLKLRDDATGRPLWFRGKKSDGTM